jgi:diguanylate cyclase (GGDEF)-like protein/PAS domain S-box-containing protein
MADGGSDAPNGTLAGASAEVAQRIAMLAGISARLASSPASDLEQALSESLDDLLLDIEAERWTLVLRPGDESLGSAITPVVLAAVEEALRARLPVINAAATDPPGSALVDALVAGGVASVLAVSASAAGHDLAVLVLERTDPGPWRPESVALVRAIADIFGGALARRRAEDAARRADDRYRRLLETSAEGVCLLAPDGTIHFANNAFASLVGVAPPALPGTAITRFIAGGSQVAIASRLLHESARFDVELHRPDGTRRWASCSTSALRDDVDGALALVMMTDISVRRAAEAALRSSEARFRALVRSSSDVIIVTDAAGLVAYASPAVHDVLGHDPIAMQGTSPLDFVHPDDLPRVSLEVRTLWEARSGSHVIRCRIATAAGGYRHMEIVITNLIDDAAVSGLTLTARDISDQVELQARLTHAATHDAVTGLSNRRVFNQRLSEQLRSGSSVAVLFADLNGFKAVNDDLGHETGDELLRVIANRLVEAVRDGDLVVRHGGDEFAILCPGIATPPDAELVASRIVASLAEEIVIRERAVVVGVSIGIAMSSALAAPSSRTLVAAADAAMYRAKSERSGWTFATGI